MDLEQYRKDFVDQINLDAQVMGMTPDARFIEDRVEALEELGDLEDPNIKYFGQKSRFGKMVIDGYSFNQSERSLVLFQGDYRNTPEKQTITRTDLEDHFKQMKRFLEACLDGLLANYCDDSNEYVKVADEIRRRFNIKHVNNEEDQSIERVRFIIFTNAGLSTLVRNIEDDEIEGLRIERTIWSLERFFELYNSGLQRETIEIDLRSFGSEGIQCIRADMSGQLDYDAYLAIIPGKLLSDIYYRYGSRLLEGNVRAFLSNRGKINQGIRRTILTEPTKFFTYNNGIACTADKIEIANKEHGLVITKINDLQIINGGQTTASLTSAFLKDKSDLSNIYVPAKITVIHDSSDYDNMVQNISRCANSQNKVTDADFFSNHPFHVAFEALSKRVLAPAAKGAVSQTYWYYERSRGKYNQEMFKMKESEKNAFQTKYPKNQIIKKEELGKYYNTIKGKPNWVVRGAAKNMNEFAKTIDDIWSKNKEQVNEAFFKHMVCAAIMFRETDKLVAHSPWYQTGGFKSQVIPYTISKVLSSLPEGRTIDWDLIWRRQTMYPELVSLIESVAKTTNDFVQDTNGALVSEFVKREETWKKYRNLPLDLPDSFLRTLVDINELKDEKRLAAKDQKESNDLDVETKIYELGAPYWRRLLQEGQERGILGPIDIGLLKVICSIDTARPQIPSPKQMKAIWRIRQRLGENGVLI